MKTAVVGGGSWGCALAQVLVDNNHEVNLWAYDQSSVDLIKSQDNPYIDQKSKEKINLGTNYDLVKDAKIILLVTPMFALRPTLNKIKPFLDKEAILVLCSKGIEQESLKSGYEVIEEELPNAQAVILSGPTHAEEVAKRIRSAIVATSKDENLAKEVQQALTNDYFRIYTNTDVLGVELCGAVKNILAIAAGYCDGAENLGDNTKAMLLTRGLRELRELASYIGADPATVLGLTGVGDLMVTAFSQHSRNRKFGELLGTGLSVDEAKEKVGMIVEGYYSLMSVHKLITKYNLDLPVIEMIYDLVYNKKDVNEIIKKVTSRSLKAEN